MRHGSKAAEDVGTRCYGTPRLHKECATLGVTGGALLAGRPADADQRPAADQCADVAAPMKNVEGRVAFITGGSSGIGLGIRRAFFYAGMKVVLDYRTREHADRALEHFKSDPKRVHAIKVDVVDRAAISQAAEETIKVLGKVHALVNNAGVVHLQSLEKTTFDDWDWLMGINVNGVFNGGRAFLPLIESHGEGGQIVTTASAAGLVAGYSNLIGAYTASKYAVVGLMESLRAELDGGNIGVSVFCPGNVRTNVMDSARNRPAELKDTRPLTLEGMKQEPSAAPAKSPPADGSIGRRKVR